MSSPSTTPNPAGTAPTAPRVTTCPARAACSWRSQFAVLRTCQMPLRFGLPSAVRAGSAPIAVAATPSWRRAVIIKAAIALANLAAAICLVILRSPSTDRPRQDSGHRTRSKTSRRRSAIGAPFRDPDRDPAAHPAGNLHAWRDNRSRPDGRDAQNLIMVLRVIVTLLVTPTGPPLARWNAAYCS